MRGSTNENKLKWKFLGQYEFEDTNTTLTQSFSNDVSELLIEYGFKNDDQVYSGATLVLKNTQDSLTHPSFVPSYNGGNIDKIFYFNLPRGSNTLSMRMWANNSSSKGMMNVYCR